MPSSAHRPPRPMSVRKRPRRRVLPRGAIVVAIALALAFAIGAVADGSTPGALESKIGSSRSKEGEVRAGIHADSSRIAGFQGNIDDLQSRLSALESSLSVERNLLDSIRSQLSVARTQLAALQVQLVHDRRVLVAQVVSSYESPPPDIATVILEAHGFADLIERVDDLRAISRENAAATTRGAEEQHAVTAEAERLGALEASHARETRAVLVQRDEVAQLHLALVTRQLQFIQARDRKSTEV